MENLFREYNLFYYEAPNMITMSNEAIPCKCLWIEYPKKCKLLLTFITTALNQQRCNRNCFMFRLNSVGGALLQLRRKWITALFILETWIGLVAVFMIKHCQVLLTNIEILNILFFSKQYV